ncbi:MAG: DUF4390 domain-containing protein [Thiotrichales bacterium]|nr:DUF4390 domain-containing protein [Thiotrichales bacterium]
MLILVYGVSASVYAGGIKIDWMETEQVDGKFLLNARVSYAFSREVLDAIEHGVALYFNVHVITSIQRKLLWDKTISTDTLNYRLEYHPLSQRYLLTEYEKLKRYDYISLDAALNSMGSIKEYLIADRKTLLPDEKYITRIRVMLDNKSLPAPLRPLSFLSSDWQLSSSWKSVELQP